MRIRLFFRFIALLVVVTALMALPEASPVAAQAKKAKPKKPTYVLYPRKLEDIKKVLEAIASTSPPKEANELDLERHRALCRLKSYRYLAELAYENIVLDDQYNKLTQAGAALCNRIGQLDHKPMNPGLPEAEYRLAYLGTSHSNMAGTGDLVLSVDSYMYDSDQTNINRVGHRRWCLNPAMLKTGFGKSGQFATMYAHDTGQLRIPDFDTVCYPARGYMPVEFFGPRHAWSVSLHAAKFRPPDPKTVIPKIFEADADGFKTGEPLKLDHTNVNLQSTGTANCIIFRPAKIDLTPGKRYVVEIEGVIGAGRIGLAYLVEFVSLK